MLVKTTLSSWRGSLCQIQRPSCLDLSGMKGGNKCSHYRPRERIFDTRPSAKTCSLTLSGTRHSHNDPHVLHNTKLLAAEWRKEDSSLRHLENSPSNSGFVDGRGDLIKESSRNEWILASQQKRVLRCQNRESGTLEITKWKLSVLSVHLEAIESTKRILKSSLNLIHHQPLSCYQEPNSIFSQPDIQLTGLVWKCQNYTEAQLKSSGFRYDIPGALICKKPDLIWIQPLWAHVEYLSSFGSRTRIISACFRAMIMGRDQLFISGTIAKDE